MVILAIMVNLSLFPSRFIQQLVFRKPFIKTSQYLNCLLTSFNGAIKHEAERKRKSILSPFIVKQKG